MPINPSIARAIARYGQEPIERGITRQPREERYRGAGTSREERIFAATRGGGTASLTAQPSTAPPQSKLQQLQGNVDTLQNQKLQRNQSALNNLTSNMEVFTSNYFTSLAEGRQREVINNLLESYSGSAAPGTFELFTPDEHFPADYVEEIQPRIKKIWASKDLNIRQKLDEIKAIVLDAPGSGMEPLDEATATQILQEAGGDKEKARALARQRGYSF